MTNNANYCFSEVRRRIFAAGDCFASLAMTGPGIVIASEAKQSPAARMPDRSYDIES
jgi:hypothetical protein